MQMQISHFDIIKIQRTTEIMHLKQQQDKNIEKSKSENKHLILQDQKSSSKIKEEIREADEVFSSAKKANLILLCINNPTRSATLNVKPKNRVKAKLESSEEEKIKEAIAKKDSEIEQLKAQNNKLSKECEEIKNRIEQAQQTNNQKAENNCMMRMQMNIEERKLNSQQLSSLRSQVSRLQKKLQKVKNEKI